MGSFSSKNENSLDIHVLFLLAIGRCPIPTLFNFIQTAPGVRIDRSLSFIFTDSTDDEALGGSNITVRCANGYKNVGGAPTIICTDQNVWTPFPNCVSTSSSTTTAIPTARCPVTADTWTFTNAYMSSTSGLTIYSDDTAIGFVVVSCSSGYTMDSVSGDKLSCNKGVWSTRPSCTSMSLVFLY